MLTSRYAAVLLALLGFGAAGLVATQSVPLSGPGTATDLFAKDRILDVDIRMAASDWHEVRISHRNGSTGDLSSLADDDAYEYRRAEVRIDGVAAGTVGVRKKGFFGSAVSTRPSMKIKFDEFVTGQTFSGVDTITLNNNNQDQTFVQQHLTYDLFARAGVPASRANFARVRVNGEDLGIYTHVEPIGKSLLTRLFGNSNGFLYESYAGDFTDAEIGSIVEKRAGADQDRGRLAELKTALARPGPVSLPEIEALVNLDGFIRMWAAEVLIGHWDGYSGNRNNFYLYLNPSSRKFEFLPWGPDAVFTDPGPFITQPVPRSVKAVGILSRRLWELPAIRNRYRTEMARLLAGPWNEARLRGDMMRLQALLQPRSTVSREIVSAASATALTFIDSRRSQVTPELVAPGPDWPAVRSLANMGAGRSRMTITGSFTAPWQAAAPFNPLAAGTATLGVAVEGKPAPAFSLAGAFSTTNGQTIVSPASLRQQYKVITVTALTGAKVWQITMTIDPHQLTATTRELAVDHFTVWAVVAEVEPANPSATKVRIFGVVGQVRFDEVSPVAGGRLRGTFTLQTPEL